MTRWTATTHIGYRALNGMPEGIALTAQEYPIPQQKGTAMLKLAPVLALIGSPAVAQMQCGGYADAVAFLYERYGESLTVQGIDGAAYLALAGELSALQGK